MLISYKYGILYSFICFYVRKYFVNSVFHRINDTLYRINNFI